MARLNSIQSDNKTTILIFLALVGTVNIVAHVIPTAIYVGLLLAIQLLFVDKKDNAVIFIALGSVAGAVFATQGVRFVGVFLMALGFLWVIKDFLKSVNRLTPSILVLFVVFLLLYISVMTTSGGFYAESKLKGTMINAALYLLSLGHIVLFPKKHNGVHLGYLYLCYATIMMMYMNEIGGVGGALTSLFRLAGYRSEWGEYMMSKDKEDVFSFNYQTIGLYVCIGFALFYLNNPEKRDRLQRNVMWFLTILLVLYSGSRQSLYALAAILLLYYFVKNDKAVSQFGSVALFGFMLFVVMTMLDSSVSDFLLGNDEMSSDSARSQIRSEAMAAFDRNPITGVGYGRFCYMGEYSVDEHNIIAEILAELGILGFSVLGFLFGGILSFNLKTIKQNKREIYPFIAVFVAVLVRCMVSTSLLEGIMLFVLISLLPQYTRYKKLHTFKNN